MTESKRLGFKQIKASLVYRQTLKHDQWQQNHTQELKIMDRLTDRLKRKQV